MIIMYEFNLYYVFECIQITYTIILLHLDLKKSFQYQIEFPNLDHILAFSTIQCYTPPI